MTNDNRVPAGVPTGGEFATGAKAENDDLAPAIDISMLDRKIDAEAFVAWADEQVSEALEGSQDKTHAEHIGRVISHLKKIGGDTSSTKIVHSGLMDAPTSARQFKSWVHGNAYFESVQTEAQAVDDDGEPTSATHGAYLADLTLRLERIAANEYGN